LAAIGIFVATAAHASPILTVAAGNVVGTITVSADSTVAPVFDVTGAALGSVDEATTSEHLGAAVVNAPGGGTALLGSTTVAEALNLVFDFNSSTGVGSPEWIIPVSGSNLSPTVTDPALIGFLGSDFAHFAFVSSTPIISNEQQVGLALTYSLTTLNGTGAPVTGQAIPEPASLCLVGTGLLMAYRRRQSSKNRA
jgi:hypothetical protein